MLSQPDRAALAAQVAVSTEWTNKFRGIYRWHPTLAYGPTHFSVSYDDGDGVVAIVDFHQGGVSGRHLCYATILSHKCGSPERMGLHMLLTQ